jgi:hypothetical protein
MAIGDAAAAAGMVVVNPLTDTVKAGADHHNKTRDYIAERTSAVQPIAKGGTGATTAAQARTNLGLREGATLDVAPADAAQANKLPRYNANAQLTTANPTLGGHATSKSYVDGRVAAPPAVTATGDVYAGGNLRTPGRVLAVGVRGTEVVTNYASVYVDGNGWFGITPSALRFKRDIVPHPYTLEQALDIGVVSYRLRDAVEADANAPAEVGVIAEQLVDAGLREFVVFDDAGNTQSVAYDRLALVALGGLAELAQRVVELELAVEQLLEAPEAGA